MVVQKDKVKMLLSSDTLLEMRKVLFRRGISTMEFFTFMAESVANHDSNLEHFFDLIKIKQMDRIEKGEKRSIVEDTFYDIFEKKFNRLNKENNDEEDL